MKKSPLKYFLYFRGLFLLASPGIEPGILESKSNVLSITLRSLVPTVGIEPTIYRLEGGRLIHWATRAVPLCRELNPDRHGESVVS